MKYINNNRFKSLISNFKTSITLCTFFFCFISLLQSQPLLELEETIDIALKNNLNLKTERFNSQVSRNSISKANAGLLPTVDLSGQAQYGLAPFTQQELGIPSPEGGNTINEFDFTNSTNFSVAADANYTLFDGKQGQYRYQQLTLQYDIDEVQLKMLTEQVVNETVAAYIAVARQQSLIRINEQSIELSQERLDRLQSQAKYGTVNSLQLIQAEVDLKSDSASMRTTALNLKQAKNDLNLLLGRSAEEAFSVNENFALTPELTYNSLLNDLSQRNTAINLNNKLLALNNINLNTTKAAFLPSVQAYGQASYLHITDQANILRSNEILGVNVGIRASYSLFDGGVRKMREQNAIIAVEQQISNIQKTELDLTTQLRSTFSQYEDSKAQLRIEASNLMLFEENYDRTNDSYEMGQATATDLRTAQLNLDAAKNRINNLKYNIKLSETILLYLSGRLVE